MHLRAYHTSTFRHQLLFLTSTSTSTSTFKAMTTTWCCNSGDEIYARDGINGGWERMDGAANQISASPCGQHIWAVNAAQEVSAPMCPVCSPCVSWPGTSCVPLAAESRNAD